MSPSDHIKKLIDAQANPKKAIILQRFFKTGRGEYGSGDIFVGVTVPVLRTIVKTGQNISLSEIKKLLQSPIHEHRFVALEILVSQFEFASTAKHKKQIFDFYLHNRRHINNWDLVDTSAPYIVGEYIVSKEKTVLYNLAGSRSLWDRRIAIVATFACIRKNKFSTTIHIARQLLHDKHDLIHKAVGWMLREVGKRDVDTLQKFLNVHYRNMPRTMLRYAIEKFPSAIRQKYLRGVL